MDSFVVDISSIKSLNGAVLPVDVKGSVCMPDFTASVRLTGNAVNRSGFLYSFSGRLEGIAEVCCARCLSPVELPYDAEIEFDFSNSADEANDDSTFLFKGDKADFESIIVGFVKSDMPIVVLCDENCKGLCEKCGQNLNIGGCNCIRDLINPVIDKNIFK